MQIGPGSGFRPASGGGSSLPTAPGLAFTTGCLSIPLGRKQGSPALGPSTPALAPDSTAAERNSPKLQHKEVAQNQEPSVLVAADQTRCGVDREKFESVKKGDAVWCVWRQ